MKRLILFTIIAIWLTISLWVRSVGLDHSPISLLFDEAGLGYNAFSLLTTGKDERGNVMPINIVSLDFKPAIYSYLTVPFIKISGLTQASTRIASALSGTLMLLFLLALFKKFSQVSWVTAIGVVGFLSFLPWHLHFSRIAFEPNVSGLFFIGSVWFFLKWLNKQKPSHLIPLLIFSTLAIYSYNGSRFALPILIGLALLDPIRISNVSSLKNKIVSILKVHWPLVLILVIYVPLLASNGGKWLSERVEETNILANYPFAGGPAHPVYYFASSLLGHIQSYFSTFNLASGEYPWITGSPQGIGGTGTLGWIGGGLIVLGILKLLSLFPASPKSRFIVYWIVAASLPAVITKDWFHPLRAVNALLGLEILVGWGAVSMWETFKSKGRTVRMLALPLLLGIGAWSAVYNINNELNFATSTTAGEFQPGGYKEGARLLNLLKDQFETVYLDSPHTQNYILFITYLNYPANKIQSFAAHRPPPNFNGDSNFNFDNFVYRKYDINVVRSEKSIVYWTSSEVKEEEVKAIPGTAIYKIFDSLGRQAATVVTKE